MAGDPGPRTRSPLAGGSLALLIPAAACLTGGLPEESAFPPDDFFLEVRHRDDDEPDRRVRVWADGLVWLGEELSSERELAERLGLPVLGAVCVYRLRPESIRQLSRELDRSGLQDADRGPPDPRDATAELTAITWHAFGVEITAWAAPGASGAVARASRIIDAYLPLGHGITVAGAAGESLPRRVFETPQPQPDVDGALTVARRLLDERRVPGMAAEAVALALAADDLALARELLPAVRRDDPLLADQLARALGSER